VRGTVKAKASSWAAVQPKGHGREGMTGERRQLCFGVMCAGTRFAAWEAECLDRLVALENTYFALLIIDKRGQAPLVRPGPIGDEACYALTVGAGSSTSACS
jgi:hypothetical protein